jgi:hypothetical protein
MKLSLGKATSSVLKKIVDTIYPYSISKLWPIQLVFHSVIGMEVEGRDLGVGLWFQHIGDRYSSINSLIKEDQHAKQ